MPITITPTTSLIPHTETLFNHTSRHGRRRWLAKPSPRWSPDARLPRSLLPRLHRGAGIGGQLRGAVLNPAVILLLEVLHLADVLARFLERRHAAEALHVAFSRVVCGDDLRLVSVEAIAQIAEVLRARADVLCRVREIARAHPPPGPRHELHQTHSARTRS